MTDETKTKEQLIAELTALRRRLEDPERAGDVSKRVSELEETANFFNSIIENTPTMVFIKEAANLQFVHFNKAAEELLGVDREEMLGKNDHDLFQKEQADFFAANDRKVLAEGKLVDIPEEPIETHRGTRYLHTMKVPILGSGGQPEYLLGISEDVTARK